MPSTNVRFCVFCKLRFQLYRFADYDVISLNYLKLIYLNSNQFVYKLGLLTKNYLFASAGFKQIN